MKLKPLADRVVVDPKQATKVSPGGIVIPDAAQEKSQQGVVIARGPSADEVMIGDVVLFRQYTGTEVEVEGETYLIFKQEDLLAVVE